MFELVQSRVGRRLAGLVGLSMAALGGGGLLWLFHRTTETHDDTVERLLGAVAAEVAASFSTYDSRLARHPIEDLAPELSDAADHSLAVEVFDARGIIHWADEPGRRGQRVPLAVISKIRTATDAANFPPGNEAFSGRTALVAPLRKRPACLPCHAGSPDPIGGIYLAADKKRLLGGRVGMETVATLALVLVVATLIGIVLFLTDRMLLGPLGKLARVMSQVEEGDFFARAEVNSNDEIGMLASTFNKLISKITDLRVERIDAEREMKTMKRELQLKAQLEAKQLEVEASNAQLEDRVRQLSFLYALSRELSRELDPDVLLGRLADLVKRELHVPEFSVILLEDGHGEDHALSGRVAACAGFPPEAVDLGTLFPLAGSVSAEAIETNKAIYVPDLSRDARGIAYRTPAGRRGSILVVPVTYQDRRLGTMNFSSSIVDAFTPGQRELMITAGHQAALALANAQLFRQTLELARTDGLTGIANRRSLEERLEMEWAARERYQGSLSVLMIDIDHFKHYNDNQGHQLGDEALRRVAQALAGSVRKVDGVGRYGGEEFLVLLPRTDKEQAIQVAEKLRRVIEAMRFERDTDQPLGRITVSAGVASAPLDADTLATLVARADAALFAAKNGGRNRVVPYRAQS